MLNILALDTSTEACSVSLRVDGDVCARWELIPRQHNQRLFGMLQEVLPEGGFADAGVSLLTFAEGPGSFTGLRIAASAIQGLAYSNSLPVVGISTLACMAQGAYRRAVANSQERVLVMLDARINEIYCGLYEFENGLVRALVDDQVCAPGELAPDLLEASSSVLAIGSGLAYLSELPQKIQSRIAGTELEFWPDSIDLLPLAEARFDQNSVIVANQVEPVYLRNEISWKKLSEQGR